MVTSTKSLSLKQIYLSYLSRNPAITCHLNSKNVIVGVLAGLEWTILEITVMGLIGIGCLVGIIKGFYHFKSLIQEKREKAKSVRKQKIRSQVEAELTEKSAGSHKSADLAPENNQNQLCRAERRESKPEIVLTFP